MNDNETLSPAASLVEAFIEDLLAEAAEDDGEGWLEARSVLIEMASQCLTWTVLEYGIPPEDAFELVRGRALDLMIEVIERHQARLPPVFRLVDDPTAKPNGASTD